jgi:hypothetical protein
LKVERCLVTDLGGTPMLDDGFNASSLATLTAAVRRRIDGGRQNLEFYLDPEVARKIYLRSARRPVSQWDSVEMGFELQCRLKRSCSELTTLIPKWSPFLSVPIHWRLMTGDLASSSNPVIPQHILLGHQAFAGHRILHEHIVHELSHVWIGMIEEVAPLAMASEADVVLPSGTPGKDIRQVMYALTFGTTAMRLYRARNAAGVGNEAETNRLKWLDQYVRGCLDIATSSGKLLPNGFAIADSCARFIQR